MIALAIAVGGGLGAVVRSVLDGALRARWPGIGAWSTAVINVTGSLILGALAGLLLRHAIPGGWEQALGTGFCGGYTTFSTATVETVRLAAQRRAGGAAAYALTTLVLSVAACAAGYALAS